MTSGGGESGVPEPSGQGEPSPWNRGMSFDAGLPAAGPIGGPGAQPFASMPGAGTIPAADLGLIRHRYPLVVRDASLTAAFGLLLRTLPYALMRFAVMVAFTVITIIWLCVTFGGAALASRIAPVFGVVWFVLCAGAFGWVWWGVLRYGLHLIACGHVAVLTELITKGQIGNGTESMFAYGRRIVTDRIGQVSVLFGLNALVRGVLESFHRTLDWISEMLPIPGLEAIASLINVVLRAATRYLDKAIFSYILVRADTDPWTGAREGIVYYAQNAKLILKTSLWVVVLERVLSLVMWLVLLAPAAAITLMLPASVRNSGSIISVVIALLLAGSVRSAFIKPLFLIMILVRFHTEIENQPINEAWDARLAALSGRFADLGRRTQEYFVPPAMPRGPATS